MNRENLKEALDLFDAINGAESDADIVVMLYEALEDYGMAEYERGLDAGVKFDEEVERKLAYYEEHPSFGIEELTTAVSVFDDVRNPFAAR